MDGTADIAGMVLAAVRVLTYTGFVLLAGTLMFWVLVWPSGSRYRLMALTAIGGSALLFVTTVAEPALRLWLERDAATALSRVEGTAAILRLAVLACLAGFFTDLVDRPVVGRRRLAAVVAVVVLTATLAVPAAAAYGAQPGAVAHAGWTLASAGELLGAAGWLGGLAALAVLIVAQEDLNRLEGVIPRFSRVVAACLVVLVATSVVEALSVVVFGSAERGSAYTALVLTKAAALALMLLLAAYGRWHTDGMALRRLRTAEQAAQSPSLRRMTGVVRLELATGMVVLVTSSALVALRPGG